MGSLEISNSVQTAIDDIKGRMETVQLNLDFARELVDVSLQMNRNERGNFLFMVIALIKREMRKRSSRGETDITMQSILNEKADEQLADFLYHMILMLADRADQASVAKKTDPAITTATGTVGAAIEEAVGKAEREKPITVEDFRHRLSVLLGDSRINGKNFGERGCHNIGARDSLDGQSLWLNLATGMSHGAKRMLQWKTFGYVGSDKEIIRFVDQLVMPQPRQQEPEIKITAPSAPITPNSREEVLLRTVLEILEEVMPIRDQNEIEKIVEQKLVPALEAFDKPL